MRKPAPAWDPTCSAMPACWCAPPPKSAKPNGERLREYADSQLPLVEKSVLDDAPVYPEREQLALEFWLSKLRESLTADAPGTKLFLGKDSPEDAGGAAGEIQTGRPGTAHAIVGWRRGGDQGQRRSHDQICAGHRCRQPRRAQGL